MINLSLPVQDELSDIDYRGRNSAFLPGAFAVEYQKTAVAKKRGEHGPPYLVCRRSRPPVELETPAVAVWATFFETLKFDFEVKTIELDFGNGIVREYADGVIFKRTDGVELVKLVFGPPVPAIGFFRDALSPIDRVRKQLLSTDEVNPFWLLAESIALDVVGPPEPEEENHGMTEGQLNEVAGEYVDRCNHSNVFYVRGLPVLDIHEHRPAAIQFYTIQCGVFWHLSFRHCEHCKDISIASRATCPCGKARQPGKLSNRLTWASSVAWDEAKTFKATNLNQWN